MSSLRKSFRFVKNSIELRCSRLDEDTSASSCFSNLLRKFSVPSTMPDGRESGREKAKSSSHKARPVVRELSHYQLTGLAAWPKVIWPDIHRQEKLQPTDQSSARAIRPPSAHTWHASVTRSQFWGGKKKHNKRKKVKKKNRDYFSNDFTFLEHF